MTNYNSFISSLPVKPNADELAELREMEIRYCNRRIHYNISFIAKIVALTVLCSIFAAIGLVFGNPAVVIVFGIIGIIVFIVFCISVSNERKSANEDELKELGDIEDRIYDRAGLDDDGNPKQA